MNEYESQSHAKSECKYHVVFIPKFRRKTLHAQPRGRLGAVFRRIVGQKESQAEEGNPMADHVHMIIAIPPNCTVSKVVGFIKGKSAVHLANLDGVRKGNFVEHFLARGDCVSTLGRDEAVIREYNRKQELDDQRLHQMNLWRYLDTVPVVHQERGRVSDPVWRFRSAHRLKPPTLPGDTCPMPITVDASEYL
jgi:putative transposase